MKKALYTLLVLVLFTAVTVLATLLYTESKREIVTELPAVEDPEPAAPEVTSTGTPEEEFLNSQLKVIGIAKHPESKFQIVMATDRSDDEYNDTGCGSIYTMPTCYFFIEEGYHVDTPDAKFVAKYGAADSPEGTPGAYLNTESIEFIGTDTIEFIALDGDAGTSWGGKWSLDLNTGEFTLLEDLGETIDY